MGRANHTNGLFTQLAQKDIRGAAYSALGARARATITELTMSYWEGTRANPQVITQRWLADRIQANPKTAAKVINELESHWFLELERKGKTTGPLGERGSLYRLTWLPTSDGHPPGNDSRGWLPEIIINDVSKTDAYTHPRGTRSAAITGSGRGSNRGVGTDTRIGESKRRSAGSARASAITSPAIAEPSGDTRNDSDLSCCEPPLQRPFSIYHATGVASLSMFHPMASAKVSYVISR